ncbi:hypothetical protein QZH41_020801, partial [Actinostola sp. cb2023]
IIGCYPVSEESRLFHSSAGDYDPTDVSPMRCVQLCGARYKYAALQAGNICLCANSIPTSGKLNDADCNTPCPGSNSWPDSAKSLRCGGPNKNSIYSAGARILGLTLQPMNTLAILKPVYVHGNLSNGLNVYYTFNLGDGTQVTKPSNQPIARHIYDQPGSYVVTFTASNTMSGSVTSSRVYKVDDPIYGINLACPPSAKVGQVVECMGSLTRGSRVNTTFAFTSGHSERLSISAQYYSTGAIVPRTNDTVISISLNMEGTLIVPAFEFQHSGKVTHWDFEAIKIGFFTLQIFRPTCSADQKYCVSTKSCVSSSTACDPLEQRRCANNELFCIFRKQCLPNTEASMKSCAPYTPYKFSSPPADYKLVFRYRVEIIALGHHIVDLPLVQEPQVHKGDVLGLGLGTAELGYKSISVDQGVSFHYSASASNVGDKLLRTSSPAVHQKHFVFAAHFAHSARFVIRDQFASTGIKSVTSNITEPSYVTIDYPVANVTFTFRQIANTNDTISFSVSQHPGSNTTYIWDFGNGQSLRTQSSHMTYAYPWAGGFIVKLTAENSVNSITIPALIYIYDPIAKFKFSQCPVKAKALGETTAIEWQTGRGTNITYVVDFGDGTSRHQIVTTGSRSYKGHTTHRYAALGNYTVSIYGYNLVGPNISIHCHAVVETPLAGLEFSVPVEHVTSNIYLAVGDFMIVNRHFKHGTNIRCSHDFKDGSPSLISHQVSASHKYNTPGQYKVNVTCYNDISSITKILNATVIVQVLKAISGLSVRGPATRITTKSNLTLDMNEGTTYFCNWEFGDGTLLKTDASHTGKPMVHTYSAINTYGVVITCSNRLGSVRAETKIPVDTPVETVTITSNKRYFRVNEDVVFDVKVLKGSRLLYVVKYGDGKSTTLQRSASGLAVAGRENFTHAYTTDGSFTVTVTASNALGAVVQTLSQTIVVEFPVQDIIFQSTSPVRLYPGVASLFLSVVANVTVPTNAYCIWTFNDGTPVSSPEPLKIKPLYRTHKYTKDDTFVVNVNISNHVSTAVLETSVRVQKIQPVVILPKHEVNGKIVPGSGPEKIYFAFNETIVFNSTSQPDDISYTWHFGDGAGVNASAVSHTRHVYMSAGRYYVKVSVRNILAVLTSTKQIVVQDLVGDVSVKSNIPTFFTDPTRFYLSIKVRGSDSCFLLAMGDNQGVYFGGEVCRPKVFRANETYIKISDDMLSINYTHTYANMGNYTAVLTAWNHVSMSKSSTFIIIKDYPCLRPSVRIKSDGTKSNPKKIKKSDALVLDVDLTFNCPVARSIVFMWKAYEVTLANPDDKSKPIRLPTDETRTFDLPTSLNVEDAGAMKIRERFFPFMTLKFSLKIGFIGRDRDLSYYFATHSVWLDVERSELGVIIKGGQRRSVGYELDMVLDGSESKDPDDPSNKTGITYQWFCRKKKETWPSEFDPPNPTGGCWGNGVFSVNSTGPKASIYTGDFFQNAIYVFKLACRRDTRESSFEQSITILPGQPPTMSLRCNFNCLRKMNPKERLVLETLCVDCKPTDKLGYEWSLFLLELGKDKEEMKSWTKQAHFATNTSTGTDKGNMVVKPDYFIPEREYFLRLNAWKPGGYPGGFVEYQFLVNVGPTGGNCQVHPLEGFALDTDFKVQCNNWHDTDTPLQYMIELDNGGDIVPVFAGYDPVTSAVFPLGKEENNFTMEVRIKVMDKYFLATSTKFSIRVTEPKSVDYDEVGSSVSSAVGSGNPQEATQVTNAVSSVLNAKASKADPNDVGAQDERAKFRGEVAKSLTNLPADSFDGVAQKGEALSALTQSTDEVKEDAQESSIKAMDDMGSYLSGADSSRNLDTTAKSLFSGIGNIVGASSKTAKKAANSSTGEDPVSGNFVQKYRSLSHCNCALPLATSPWQTPPMVDTSLGRHLPGQTPPRTPDTFPGQTPLRADTFPGPTPPWADTSPGRHLPWADTSPGRHLTPSLGRHLPGQTPDTFPGQTPTWADTSPGRHKSTEQGSVSKDISTNNTKKALGVVDKVSGALMKQLVAGDKPKAIKTGNMDLAIGRKNLDDLGADDDEESEEEGDTGGFRLPNPAALFGGANATTEEGATSGIGTTMTAMAENPFPADEKAKDLDSKTVGLALTDGNGKPLDLAGQTLEMFVPRDVKKNPVKPMVLNHYAADDPPMRVHKFNRTTNDSAIVIEIQVFDPKVKFAIMLRFEKRPTAQHFDFNHTFASLEEAKKMRKRPHPFTYVVNHVRLREKLTYDGNGSEINNGTAGTYFLGIKAINKDLLTKPNTSYAMRIYLPACKSFDEDTNQWVAGGCVVGNKTRCNLTHCVCMPGLDEEGGDIDPTTLPPSEPPTAAYDASSQGGSAAKPLRKRRFVRKKVSKISLASSFFPAPNPIDFGAVFDADIMENPISLVTVLAIGLLYVVLAIYARREDKKDVGRAGVTPLEDNEPSDAFRYEITLYTGYGKKAATTSQVSFILAGDEGESEPRLLKDPKRKTFQRRGVDIFLATFPESLGEINYLHIWHDNSGKSPSWYLSRVIIEDLSNDKKYLFITESWLAVEIGDGSVDRLIPVAGKDEMTSFNHLFYSTTQTKLADGHLWFSIFMRPARSRFTRLQRLSCCLTLLYCSMLANAMFYNIGGESDPSSTLQLGPLSFSPAQIGIGIMSSLVVVPANIFIVGVFRGTEAKPTAQEVKEKKQRKFWWLYELCFCFFDRSKPKNDFISILHKNHNPDDQFLDVSTSSSRAQLTEPQSMTDLSTSSRANLAELEEPEPIDLGLGEGDIDFKISKQEKREEMAKRMKKKKKKKKKLFPYWFLYVGWTVCFCTCFICAFFIVLYGLQFGKEKSAQWLSSMLISFFQDVLISQPIKVVAIALVFAAIIKKPPADDDEEDPKKLEDQEFMHESGGSSGAKRDKRIKPKGMIRLKPPNKDKLKKDRELRFREMQMNAAIKEVVLYAFFVTCLCIASYSHRDPSSYLFRKSMYDTFVEGNYGGIRGFSSISTRENYYEWAKTTLMNGLFKKSWYNDQPLEDLGFTMDGVSFAIGGARIRQLRVKDDTCEVPPVFNHLIKPCLAWYGYFAEDAGQYDIAWKPLKNESLYRPPFTFKSWEFYDSSELDSMPFMAYVSTYGGGGFAAELGETRDNASKIIETLENHTWIDEHTRAVITELSTYNAVSNLFCVMSLVVEFLPTNGIYLYTDLKISRLFSTSGGMQTLVVVSEFFILIFFAVFIYQELKQLYQMKKNYFKEFWNCVEFIMVILVFVCVIMFLMRIKLVENAINKLEQNPGKFVSFVRVASWSEALMIMLALLVFTTWLKGMKLLRFNPRIQVLSQTLKGAAGPLATFSIVFVIFFLAYALFAFAVFGKDVESYYNFVTTCESVMGLLLGAFDFGEIETAQPIIGPIFFFTFMVFGNFIIMNMFLTIIMDVFAEVKDEMGDETGGDEFVIVEYMIKRFRKVTGLQPNKVNIEDPEETKEMQNKFKEDMSACKTKKRNKRFLKSKPPVDFAINQQFTRLDDSLRGFYCEDFAEERMLDDIVERKWGITTKHSFADAATELKIEEERETLRHDMYAALDNFETSFDEGAFNLAFEEDEPMLATKK